MPKEVVDAILAIVMTGKQAIVKKEYGHWVVVEVIRRVTYNENKPNR